MPQSISKEWIRCKSDEAAIEAGCYFDEEKAQHICDFFENYLHLSTGKMGGELIKLLPWQVDFLKRLNGWRKADKTRRFRKAFLAIAKKNGKSLLCSGLALYFGLGDGENQPEVILAAYTREQAEIVYREAKNMINKSKQIAKLCKVIDSRKKVMLQDGDSSYIRVISSEANSAEGINASCVVMDELHAQKTRDLFDALMYAGAAREQPLFISITTAGFDKMSLCAEEWNYARRVIDSEIIDMELLPVIYSAQGMDYKDKKSWYAANPSLGTVLKESDMEAAMQRAINSPVELNTFLRYRLNIWTDSDQRWLLPDKWAANNKPHIDKDEMLGQTCFGGMDLATRSDLCSFSLYFPDYKSFLTWSWVPKDSAFRRSERNKAPYLKFAEAGELTLVDTAKVDYDVIKNFILDCATQYDIQTIAYDPWNAHGLVQDLEREGMDMAQMRQGFASMSGPCKDFEGEILDENFNFFGSQIMDWCAGNMTVEIDPSGNIKPSKAKSTEKIDPLVACIMAFGLSCVCDVKQDSVYETRGALLL